MKTILRPNFPQRGFTIVELMIAAAVFALVLLVFTAGFAQIGRLFYKGIISSKTQDVGRSVIDEISRNLQFNSGRIQVAGNVLCIGGNHYVFTLFQRVTPTTSGLRRNITSEDAACVDAGGQELLPENMRLSDFTVNCSANELCNISVMVAYGEDDVFDSSAPTPFSLCSGGVVGSQFCAVTRFQTSVIRRVF